MSSKTTTAVTVKKAGEVVAVAKKKTVRPIKVRAKKPVLVPDLVKVDTESRSTDIAVDHQGRIYRFNPNAKAPFSGHSIVYPNNPDMDEDIPIQSGREDLRGVNGASPYLLIHAATHALERSNTRLPYKRVAVQYLQAALEILKSDEAFLSQINKSPEKTSAKRAEDCFTISNVHLQSVQSKVAKTLEQNIDELLFTISGEAANVINIETKTIEDFSTILNPIK